MNQPILPRSAPVDTPWQGCAGLRASAIDGAAAMIVMEVLLDAVARLPDGRAALAEACADRTRRRPCDGFEASATEIAADVVASALIEAAGALDEDRRDAA